MPGFWKSTAMRDESALFIRQEGADNAQVSLLFDPLEVVSVTRSSGEVRYAAGRDYELVPGHEPAVRARDRPSPCQRAAELTAAVGSPPYDLRRRDGRVEILFGAGHKSHDMQVLVTYTHAPDEWRGQVSALCRRTIAEHAADATRPVIQSRLVIFGDSISAGCNASKWAGAPPFRPFYGEVFAENLAGRLRDRRRRSRSGTCPSAARPAPWGVRRSGQVIAGNSPTWSSWPSA